VVGGLPREAVPILCEHQVHAPGLHEVAHAIQAGTVQISPAPAGVGDFLEDLVPFAGGVLSDRFELLCERIAAPCLLVGGDTGVEDGRLRAVAIGARHRRSPS
jgi:hypothetical protein